MPVVMVGSFGRDQEGIYTYRVNAATEDDLLTMIEQIRLQGWKFWVTPTIEKAQGRTFTVLLKLYKQEDWGNPEEAQG